MPLPLYIYVPLWCLGAPVYHCTHCPHCPVQEQHRLDPAASAQLCLQRANWEMTRRTNQLGGHNQPLEAKRLAGQRGARTMGAERSRQAEQKDQQQWEQGECTIDEVARHAARRLADQEYRAARKAKMSPEEMQAYRKQEAQRKAKQRARKTA